MRNASPLEAGRGRTEKYQVIESQLDKRSAVVRRNGEGGNQRQPDTQDQEGVVVTFTFPQQADAEGGSSPGSIDGQLLDPGYGAVRSAPKRSVVSDARDGVVAPALMPKRTTNATSPP